MQYSFDLASQMLGDYLMDTHASTHNQYSLELLDIFQVDKKHDAPSPAVGNK